MVEDRLDRIERILENVAREQRLFAEEMRQLRASQEELCASQAKTDEQMRKTDEQISKMAKEVAGVGGGLGRVAEGLTAPSVPKVFGELGIMVERVYQRVKAYDNGKVKQEIDLLCPAHSNGKPLLLLGEVKAHLTNEDVKDFLLYSLTPFKENFPDYKDIDVIAFVAGLNVDENAARFAQRKGLYVLTATGETMKIINPQGFKPKLW